MTVRMCVLCFALLTLHGCAQSTSEMSNPQGLGLPVLSSCLPNSSGEFYFLPGILAKSVRDSDDISRSAYSNLLRSMGEPSLSCGEGGDAFRFTWMRSFDPPVTVRINIDAATRKAELHAIEMEGVGGYPTGKVARQTQKILSRSETKQLVDDILEDQLWTLPAVEDRMGGTDGSQWILELRESGRYHVLDRWSPQAGPVHRMGLRLLELAGWQFKDVH